MKELIYPIVNKLILPIFPFLLTLALQHYDGAEADAFFFLYSLSLIVSGFSDFGFRFYPYRVSLAESFLFKKIKIIFSFLASLLFFIIIFCVGHNYLYAWIFALIVPFYGFSDIGNHAMKAHGLQRQLFNISWRSWVVVLVVLLPSLLSSLQLYCVLSLFAANLVRFLFSSKLLRKFKRENINSPLEEFDLWEGVAQVLFVLRDKLPFVLYPILFSLSGLAITGVTLGVIGKISGLGIAFFEVKNRERVGFNAIEINIIILISLFLVFVYTAFCRITGIFEFSVYYAVALFLILLLSFFNQFNRMFLFSKKKSKFIVTINFLLALFVPGLLIIFEGKNAIFACVLVEEAIIFILYFLFLHGNRMTCSITSKS
ncbi:hypothetical protein [Candidatus Electrothrix sp.]|uniref:hypothetical protein n=1 Tax=Candidatus Electrothrix sp. TaxID=2170559 RepID=UPI004055B330